ncbi:MAG: phosphoribosylglycinamide formyltransferase [Lysobacterales bacterium RIFOXYD1_FULL_69_11]|nr:MAG: phosphoribosylglycinamide formyltransferase [Xanthomonadales bacterium RIFOXYA1_FULL_69_10]OHE88674.1 MAG: phosphoribosylglycinamide formyltransferase [Xanthomonadales bacterium RIFOXYD1_FULL_69_11]
MTPADRQPRPPLRIAVLASGRGSNLLAILDAIAAGILDATVAGVFSDKSRAPVLERARSAGLDAHALVPREFPNRLEFDAAMFDAIEQTAPDLVVCAGYMRLISEPQVTRMAGRMVNIHPSLLPAFKGLHTHQQALDAGVAHHGASVHFVTPELDGGPVIAQARVPVMPGDDAEVLSARVLEREHPLLVAVLRAFAAGRIALEDGRVTFDGMAIHAPLQLGLDNALTPAPHPAA